MKSNAPYASFLSSTIVGIFMVSTTVALFLVPTALPV